MQFQPVPSTAKVAVITSNGISTFVNTFHFRNPNQWGLSDLESLLQVVAASWVNDFMTSISSAIVFLRTEGRGLRAQTDVAAEFVLPTPVSGSRPGDPLPSNVSFAVTHLTGFSGRSYRGRTFFAGLSESDVSGDLLSVGRADAFKNALGSLLNLTALAGWTMVVVSRFENKVRRLRQ